MARSIRGKFVQFGRLTVIILNRSFRRDESLPVWSGIETRCRTSPNVPGHSRSRPPKLPYAQVSELLGCGGVAGRETGRFFRARPTDVAQGGIQGVEGWGDDFVAAGVLTDPQGTGRVCPEQKRVTPFGCLLAMRRSGPLSRSTCCRRPVFKPKKSHR